MATLHSSARMLLADPLTNKGSAFTPEERDRLSLHGLLPPHVFTLEQQIARRRRALEALPDDFARYTFLRELQDTNETLFQALIQSDLPRFLPLVYTPTVGEGCERFSETWRKPRGLFLSWPNRERIADILSDPALDRVKVIVVSDGERILGLGDQGAGGMGIPIGKLALYTACAGFHPAEVLPVLLDVGTDNAVLRDDPLYLGWRHARVRGAEYDAFVETFVAAVAARWPNVLLQFEDFAGHNAHRLLARYRDRLLCFNDDIQGTAATAAGTLLSAIRRTGQPLTEQRIVLFGAGAAGCGIAEMIVRLMVADGLSEAVARACVWAVDRDGLIVAGMPAIGPGQAGFARGADEVAGWSPPGSIGLAETVDRVAPTVLLGTSGQAGAFTESIVARMAEQVARPVIFALSNPTSRSEGRLADLAAWSGHRAIVGTGSPYPRLEGTPIALAQVNNVYIFPGVGLGALACGARTISDGMFIAAARALGEMTAADDPNLLPPISDLRHVARGIALAVRAQAASEGLGDGSNAAWEERIDAMMWTAEYYRAVG